MTHLMFIFHSHKSNLFAAYILLFFLFDAYLWKPWNMLVKSVPMSTFCPSMLWSSSIIDLLNGYSRVMRCLMSLFVKQTMCSFKYLHGWDYTLEIRLLKIGEFHVFFFKVFIKVDFIGSGTFIGVLPVRGRYRKFEFFKFEKSGLEL